LFDIGTDTSPTSWTGDAPSGRMRLLFDNWVKGGSLLTMPSGNPSYSSQQAWNPVSNLWLPSRQDIWVSSGCFVFHNVAAPGDGWESEKNGYVQITDSGGTEAIDVMRDGTPTFFTSGREAAAYMLSQINDRTAYPLLNGTYGLVYDDEAVSGSSATFTWTISCDETFSVNGGTHVWTAAWLKSLGWTGVTISGASTYTAPDRAIHTEEFLNIDLAGSFGSDVDGVRWLIITDCNIELPDIATWPQQPRDPKFVAYFGAAAANIDEQDDGQYTEGTDMFHCGYGPIASYDSADGAMFLGTGQSERLPCRYWIIDLGDGYRQYAMSGAGAPKLPTDGVLRIKIVDPENRAGRICIGDIFLGPGWYPRQFNFDRGIKFGAADRSLLAESFGGSFHSRFREPARKADLPWSKAFLTDEDVHEIDTFFTRARTLDTGIGTRLHPLYTDTSKGARVDRGVYMMHPLHLDNTTRIDVADPNKWARALMYGRLRQGIPDHAFLEWWHATMTFVEEPHG